MIRQRNNEIILLNDSFHPFEIESDIFFFPKDNLQMKSKESLNIQACILF